MIYLFQILCKILRKPESAGDHGTFYCNANLVNNANAKMDPLDKYDEVKEFVNIQLDALIVSATMEHLGAGDLDDVVVPDHVKCAALPVQRDWLHRIVLEVIDKCVLTTVQTSIEELQYSSKKKIYICAQCDKAFHYVGARKLHMKKMHNITTPTTPEDSSDEDGVFNYGSVFLQLALLLRDAHDAVAEGDGERIIRVWKFLMPVFKAHGSTKYAYAALNLQAQLKGLLSPRKAHQLMWNRTVNNKGGIGKRVSRDFRLEQINKVLKNELRGVGMMNLTDDAGVRVGKAIGKIEQLINGINVDLGVTKPTGHHTKRKATEDFPRLFGAIHKTAKIFKIQPGRQYEAFPQFQRHIFGKLKTPEIHKWISDKLLQWSYYQ
jgi:hypothetical protein